MVERYLVPLLMVLFAFACTPATALAQTVGVYTEQNGAVRNVVGTTPVSGSVVVAADATPADPTPNGSLNAQRVLAFNMVYNAVTGWNLLRGDANGVTTQPALSSTFWTYAGITGGIVNTTTASTMKAAAGAGVRNYICTLNVGHDALGAATELAVRDGAAGTVIFRMKLQTAANEGANNITFSPCLKGTANTLMEVVMLTASVTGGVYVNASGYTGI